MGQGALSKPVVQWWLSLNSSKQREEWRRERGDISFKTKKRPSSLHPSIRPSTQLYPYSPVLLPFLLASAGWKGGGGGRQSIKAERRVEKRKGGCII